ncbi:alpha/beta hydrolase [Flavobacterium sp.]|uniref:alpha/beta hydrolase n=1 Tax=Flavobacterium sp. TaxID=239 RepID=UPI002CA87A1E|nr:alpha/beta hydrolase [Flavobacterium sp.]HSD06611.1 alpha/beta hydrolase [Flavobacterium sp.]
MMIRKYKRNKVLKFIWVPIGIVFMLWSFYCYQAHGVGEQYFESDSSIQVNDTDDFYSFTPTKKFQDVFIFYPGALVDPKAYVPLCRKIAANNIQVYLIKMPWRLASVGYNKPKELHLFNDKTKIYILAGHSLGGKMAAQFAFENPTLINKLILLGTTHPRNFSLNTRKMAVLKIYGSKDGIADEKSIFNNKSKLPITAEFVKLDGANHSQFGYYGFQFGDNQAILDRDKQQAEILKTIMAFLNE